MKPSLPEELDPPPPRRHCCCCRQLRPFPCGGGGGGRSLGRYRRSARGRGGVDVVVALSASVPGENLIVDSRCAAPAPAAAAAAAAAVDVPLDVVAVPAEVEVEVEASRCCCCCCRRFRRSCCCCCCFRPFSLPVFGAASAISFGSMFSSAGRERGEEGGGGKRLRRYERW